MKLENKVLASSLVFVFATLLKEVLILSVLAGSALESGAIFLGPIISVFLWFILLFLPSRSWHRLVLFIPWLVQTIFLAAHLLYFSYFRVVLDLLSVIGIAGEGLAAFAHGSVLLGPELLLTLIDLPALLVLVFLGKGQGFGQKMRVIPLPRLYMLIPLALSLLALLLPAGSKKVRDEALLWRYGSLFFTFAAQTADTNVPIRPVPPSAEVANLGQTGAENEQSTPNIVCIQVESLQSGLEYLQHKGEYIMPWLHSLRDRSIYYPYCFSYHVVGGTSDAEFSIFNNVEPTKEARMVSPDYQHKGSFVHKLTELAYSKTAVHNYVKTYYSRDVAYKKIGFDSFYDFYDMEMSEPLWGSRDGEMYDWILNKTWEEPFFMYTITLSSHPGFAHIEAYHTAPFLDDIPVKRDRDALSCFNYVDKELGRFVTSFRERWPNTWFFIYGDHSLATVGFAGDLVRSGLEQGRDYLEFVPLFILGPEGEFLPAKNEARLASFHDIGPTVLGRMAMPGKDLAYQAYGYDLLNVDETKEAGAIPFRGTSYSRAELLSAISALMKPYGGP